MVAALRSAGLGVLAVMVLVLVAWATASDSGADAPDAVATALQAWLVAHHAHLAVPGGELALVPLGLTAAARCRCCTPPRCAPAGPPVSAAARACSRWPPR